MFLTGVRQKESADLNERTPVPGFTRNQDVDAGGDRVKRRASNFFKINGFGKKILG